MNGWRLPCPGDDDRTPVIPIQIRGDSLQPGVHGAAKRRRRGYAVYLELDGKLPGARLNLRRAQRQTMIGYRTRVVRAGFQSIQTIHQRRALADATTSCVVADVAKVITAARKEIRIQRYDHVRF